VLYKLTLSRVDTKTHKNINLKSFLKFVIIIISTGDSMDMIEMAFFYGDFSMLPSMQELFENVGGTTTPSEVCAV
jgi:hypothetical protein